VTYPHVYTHVPRFGPRYAYVRLVRYVQTISLLRARQAVCQARKTAAICGLGALLASDAQPDPQLQL
jgi:hypothetical protein